MARKRPHSILGEARRHLGIECKTGEHQPLDDRRRASRSGNAESRRPEMPKDQDPVQPGIQRHAEDQCDHHGPAVRGRDQKAAQHGEAEEARHRPGDRPEKAADLDSEARVVAERRKQPGHPQQTCDDRHRQQCCKYETLAGDLSGPCGVIGANRMSGKGRHCGEHARAHHGDREIETCAEPGGSQCGTAEAADHHGIGKPHRHLRQIGSGQRPGDSDSRAHFRGDAPIGKHPDKQSSHITSSQFSHDDLAILRRRRSSAPLTPPLAGRKG